MCCEIVCLVNSIGKMLNTRVSVRTSCLRNFGQVSSELNERKKKLCIEEKKTEVLQCVKLEKNKINFKEFILFYWKMKKKLKLFFFFCGLPVGGKKKK